VTVSAPYLKKLSEFLALRMGICFPKERRADLERGIIAVARELNYPDPESCIEMFISSPLTIEYLEVLAGSFTTGETYFFREASSFVTLEREVLPDLIHRHREDRRIRIWSAGCATGEEPYSIAILLSRMIPDVREWGITILATDINPRSLAKAAQGVYGDWSFRDVPAWVKEGHFRKKANGRFEILPRYREMVTFSCHNLAADSFPSLANNTNAMDMIFCRNVLMYFAEEAAMQVIRKFSRSLIEDGWLVVGPCETSRVLREEFSAPAFPGGVFYRKPSGKEKPKHDRLFQLEDVQGGAEGLAAPLPRSAAAKFVPGEKAAAALPPASAPEEETGNLRPPADSYAEACRFYTEGLYTAAEAKLLTVLAAEPENLPAMSLLTRVYANEGRLPEALSWSEKVVAGDKMDPGHHYLLATILEEQGRTDDAAQALRRALYLEPDFVIAHFALGNLRRRQGRLREAEKYFQNALVLLGRQAKDEIVPDSDGLTAGRLIEIIRAIT